MYQRLGFSGTMLAISASPPGASCASKVRESCTAVAGRR